MNANEMRRKHNSMSHFHQFIVWLNNATRSCRIGRTKKNIYEQNLFIKSAIIHLHSIGNFSQRTNWINMSMKYFFVFIFYVLCFWLDYRVIYALCVNKLQRSSLKYVFIINITIAPVENNDYSTVRFTRSFRTIVDICSNKNYMDLFRSV